MAETNYTFSQSGTLTLDTPNTTYPAAAPADASHILFTVAGYVIAEITGNGGDGGNGTSTRGGGGGGAGEHNITYPVLVAAGTKLYYRIYAGGATSFGITTELNLNPFDAEPGDAWHSAASGQNAIANVSLGHGSTGGGFDLAERVRVVREGGDGATTPSGTTAGSGGGGVGAIATGNGAAGTASSGTTPGVGGGRGGNGGSSGSPNGIAGASGCGGGGGFANGGLKGAGGAGKIVITFTSQNDANAKGILTWSGS